MANKHRSDQASSLVAQFEALVDRSRAISFRAAERRPEFNPPPEIARLSVTLTAVAGAAGYAGADVLNADVLYTDGYCAECPTPRGQRTAEPLTIRFNSARDVQRDALRVGLDDRIFLTLLLYSEEFLDLLSTEERSRFEWRRVEVVGRKSKAMYEPVASRVHVPPARLRGGNPDIYNCSTCGHSRPPLYQLVGELPRWLHPYDDAMRREQPDYYVSATSLPEPVPSCFTVGDWLTSINLVFRPERWAELTGHYAPKGIYTYGVGVAAPELVDLE